MEFKASKPIGSIAIVVDEENEITELVRIDTLKRMSFIVNHSPKQMAAVFAWGGYDKSGKFHMDTARPSGGRQFISSVEKEDEFFRSMCEDENGNPVEFYDQAFFEKLLLEEDFMGATVIQHTIDGSWPLKDVELTYGPHTVLKKVDGRHMKIDNPRPKKGKKDELVIEDPDRR